MYVFGIPKSMDSDLSGLLIIIIHYVICLLKNGCYVSVGYNNYGLPSFNDLKERIPKPSVIYVLTFLH